MKDEGRPSRSPPPSRIPVFPSSFILHPSSFFSLVSNANKTPLTSQVKTVESVPPDATAPLPGPDLLLEGYDFWERYKLPVVAAAVLLVLALVGSEIYQANHEKKLAAAGAQLDTAKTPAEYQAVIDAYPGSQAAADAYMLKGRAQMDAKDFAGAAATWRAFADGFPQHPLAASALIGQGGALESEGKFDEARAAYQKAATGYGSSYAAPFARLDEAMLLKSQRKPEEARRVYENLIASFPKSIAAQVAQEELHTLHALPPPMAPAPAATPVPTPVAAATPAPTPVAVASPAIVVPPAAPTPVAAASPAAVVSPAVPAASVPAVPSPTATATAEPAASVAPTASPDAPK